MSHYQNSTRIKSILSEGGVCLGTAITMTDATIPEALGPELDFLWIDLEHSAMTLVDLKHHQMALKGTQCASFVRVPMNDANVIKPVLDIGVDGIIIPMIENATDAAAAVAACKYPPDGIRGFGPLRPLDYGREDAAEYCRVANDELFIAVQIEQISALQDLDAILRTPGLTSISFGPQDLASALGHRTNPSHPEVVSVMEDVIAKAQSAGVPVGTSVMEDIPLLRHLIDMGIQWISMGTDVTQMIRSVRDVVTQVRAP